MSTTIRIDTNEVEHLKSKDKKSEKNNKKKAE